MVLGAYDLMVANSDCECYITTHAWLTIHGTQYQRADGYRPDYLFNGGPTLLKFCRGSVELRRG